MDSSRREFLLKIAAGTAYAAPVIRSVAAPEGLSAQANTTTGKGGTGTGMETPGMDMAKAPTPTTDIQFGPSAPWNN